MLKENINYSIIVFSSLFIFFVFLLIIFGLFITVDIFWSSLLFIFITSVFMFIVNPQATLFLFGCFLLLQSFIAGILRLQVIQNLDEAIILIFFAVMIIKKIMKRETFARTPVDIPLLCFISTGMLGTILNRVVPIPVALGGLVLSIKGFLLFYIFANTRFDESHVRFFMKGFLFIGIFFASYGLLGFLFPSIFLIKLGFVLDKTRFGVVAAQSLLGHPGAFSALMAILACYSISAVMNRNRKRFILLTALFIICIILSFRRTSLLGLILALFVTLCLRFPLQNMRKGTKMSILIILLCVLLVFSGFVISMYKDLIQSYLFLGDTPRSMLFNAGMRILRDYFPFGSGFGTFSSGINRMVYSPLYYKYGLSRVWGLSPDKPNFSNDTFWPHVLAETGIFGFLFYLLIIIGLFRICIKAITTLDKPMLKMIALGAFMVLILSLIESTKATFYEMSLWSYFYFGSIGIICVLLSINKNQKVAI